MAHSHWSTRVPSTPPSSRSPDWEGEGDLQVAPTSLVALDGLEQRLEVALAEAPCAAPLDDLEEHRGAVGDRLGEDLQQVPVLVAVGEHVEPLQVTPGQVDAGEPLLGV